MRILPLEAVVTTANAAANVPDWMVVVMGIATVFVALICQIIICKILGALVGSRTAAPAAQPAPKAAAPAAPAAPEALPQQTVAAIAAAIAETMETDVSKIRILSIKKI